MALPVYNNNAGAPITADQVAYTIRVPGSYQDVNPQSFGSGAMFSSWSFYLQAAPDAAGTTVTFQTQGPDGVWRNLADPAPITFGNSEVYNKNFSGPIGALQIVVSGSVGGGILYGQLAGASG